MSARAPTLSGMSGSPRRAPCEAEEAQEDEHDRRAPHRSVRTPTGTWKSVYVQKYAGLDRAGGRVGDAEIGDERGNQRRETRAGVREPRRNASVHTARMTHR